MEWAAATRRYELAIGPDAIGRPTLTLRTSDAETRSWGRLHVEALLEIEDFFIEQVIARRNHKFNETTLNLLRAMLRASLKAAFPDEKFEVAVVRNRF